MSVVLMTGFPETLGQKRFHPLKIQLSKKSLKAVADI